MTTTVHGSWHRASSSADIDVEAQAVSGTYAPYILPATPEPARAALTPTRTPHPGTTADAINDFFGMTRSRATHESQHDADVPPPPYLDAELPAYSAAPNTEPFTLAMYLFKFGFLFPPLWALGAIIWAMPLAPAGSSKSGREPDPTVKLIRDAEVKWAKRCIAALGVVLTFLGMVGIVALVVTTDS